MADNRDGGEGRREGMRGRDESIFSDDEDRLGRGSGRWSSDYGRERGERSSRDERGFFERAGDEVRSWFGDEEAERRRERDLRSDEPRAGYGGGTFDRSFESPGRTSRYGFGGSELGGGYDRSLYGSRPEREGRDRGERSFGGGASGLSGSRSQWDDNYRRWRDRQIQQFDSEYEDYCRERQQQFEQDFDSWRGSRLTQGGTSGQYGGAASGEALQGSDRGGGGTRSQETASGTAGTFGSEAAGASAGTGTGAAMESSGSSGGGRGSRSRT